MEPVFYRGPSGWGASANRSAPIGGARASTDVSGPAHDTDRGLSSAAQALFDEQKERRELAYWLADTRRAVGKTQVDIARAMGRAQSFVARMESATGPWPRHEHIAAFAGACGKRMGLVMIDEDTIGIMDEESAGAATDENAPGIDVPEPADREPVSAMLSCSDPELDDALDRISTRLQEIGQQAGPARPGLKAMIFARLAERVRNALGERADDARTERDLLLRLFRRSGRSEASSVDVGTMAPRILMLGMLLGQMRHQAALGSEMLITGHRPVSLTEVAVHEAMIRSVSEMAGTEASSTGHGHTAVEF